MAKNNGNGNTAVMEPKAKQDAGTKLLIRPIVVQRVTFGIRARGESPMVQHAWSEKALDMLRMTAAERKKRIKTERAPEAEGMACRYLTDDGDVGFPAMAFKASLVGAAHKDLGLEKTLVRKGLFVVCNDGNGILPMQCEEMSIREDIVRVGIGQTDIRYRPEFRGWSARIEMEIDAQLLTVQDVVNLVNRAGFGVGIGEWRPEKGGEWGRYEIDPTVAVEASEAYSA